MKPYHRRPGGEEGEASPASSFAGSGSEKEAPPDPVRGFGEPPPAEFDPTIPELKKKEKERRGAGVPWYGGSGPGGSGAGLGSLGGTAQVGSSLSGGFLGSGRVAMALANFFGEGTLLGGIFASQFGSALVLAGMAAWAGALALGAMALFGKTHPEEGVSAAFPALGPVGPSSIVIDGPKNRSLDYLGRANKGELTFDEEHPLAPKDTPKPKEEPKKDAEATPQPPPPAPQFQMPSMNDLAKRLNPAGFGKLSDGSNFSQGGAGGPKLASNGNFNLQKTFAPAGVGTRNQLQPLPKRRMIPLTGKVNRSSVQSSSAFGQANYARSASQTAYGATDAPAKQTATDAFEQGVTKGGMDTLGMTDPGGGVVVPPSSLGDVGNIPGFNAGNVTPYQNQLDNAKNAGNNAGMLKAIGIMLIIMGIALIITGIGLLNCTTFPIGLALIGAGMALMMVGFMLLAMGMMQAQNAANQGQNIGNQYGQGQQGQIAGDCAHQSYNTGTNVPTVCGDGNTKNNGIIPQDPLHGTGHNGICQRDASGKCIN